MGSVDPYNNLSEKTSTLIEKMDSLNSSVQNFNGKVRYDGRIFISTSYQKRAPANSNSASDSKLWKIYSGTCKIIAHGSEKTMNYIRNVHTSDTFKALNEMANEIETQVAVYKNQIAECKDDAVKNSLQSELNHLENRIIETHHIGMGLLIKFYTIHAGKSKDAHDHRLKVLNEIGSTIEKTLVNLAPVLSQDCLHISNFDGEKRKALDLLVRLKDSKCCKEIFVNISQVFPDFDFGIRVDKAGRKIVLLMDKNSFASGIFKKCLMTLQFRGNEAVRLRKSESKKKVAFIRNPDSTLTQDRYERNEVDNAVNYSKQLHAKMPSDENRPDLFVKYKKVSFLDAFGFEQTCLMVDYIDGGELTKALPTLDVNQQITFIKDLILAGRYLDRCNLVHRDLKPDNLMINNGHLQVIDYGFMTSAVSRGENCGTPLYNPPNSTEASCTRDSYAIGLIILDILTKGKFDGERHYLARLTFRKELHESNRNNPLAILIYELLDPNNSTRLSCMRAANYLDLITEDNLNLNLLAKWIKK